MMPRHHAAAIARRPFLAGLGATSLSLTFRSNVLGAMKQERPPLQFAVISDTHLGYKGEMGAAERWSQTANELAKSPAEFVLHLGDVVDGGREEQYPIYREVRDRIGKPVYEIPGNHDPVELFARSLRREIDIAVDHSWLKLILLNNADTKSHDGFLSANQIQWIDDQCNAAAKEDRFVIIGMHVPVHDNKHPDRGWYVKPKDGQTAFYEVMKRHQSRLLSLFHGHFHNGIRGWEDHSPVHEVIFPSALYNQDRNLEEQNAPGYNLPEFRPGFTLVTIRGTEMSLNYKVAGAESEAKRTCRLIQMES